MSIDKVLLEILGNRFTGVVEEMGYVIHRAAFTTFVKETWDFDSGLITRNGEVFAYPRNIGVTNMLSMNMKAAIDCFENYEPGDVVITNDPIHARGMATHLPDYMMFRPIFAESYLAPLLLMPATVSRKVLSFHRSSCSRPASSTPRCDGSS